MNKSVFVAYQAEGTDTNHKSFAGKYLSAGASLDMTCVSGGISLSKGIQNEENDGAWNVISLSKSIGADLGLKSPVSASITLNYGNINFYPDQKVGEYKNPIEKVYSWAKALQILTLP